MNVLEFLLVIVLAVLLSLKIKYHWRYFASLNKRKEPDAMDYLSKNPENDSFVDLINYLRFVLPVFKREFLDTDDIRVAIRNKRVVHVILWVWWTIFLAKLVSMLLE